MPKKHKNPWESQGIKKRRINTRNLIDTLLIICEGEKTEPNYFKKFPVKSEVIQLDVKGKGMNTISLVDEALRIIEIGRSEGKRYNQMWVVFDRDSFTADNFDNAINKANANKIKVAYSNEAFELWYLLHFEFLNSGINRNQYKGKISKYLGFKYKKNSNDMYDILMDKQAIAIKNANKLKEKFSDISPSKANPSTTVYKLVLELNKFIE